METTSAIQPEASSPVGPAAPPYLLRYAAEIDRWRAETLAARGMTAA